MAPRWLCLLSDSVVVVNLLFVVAPNLCVCVCFCVGSLFCYVILCVLSSFAVILLRKRELVVLLCIFDSSLIVAFSGQYSSLVFRLGCIKHF